MAKILGGLVVMLLALAVVAVIGLALSFPTMLLWNGALVPAVTFAKPITWLQAWGLMILVAFLTPTPSTTNK